MKSVLLKEQQELPVIINEEGFSPLFFVYLTRSL